MNHFLCISVCVCTCKSLLYYMYHISSKSCPSEILIQGPVQCGDDLRAARYYLRRLHRSTEMQLRQAVLQPIYTYEYCAYAYVYSN